MNTVTVRSFADRAARVGDLYKLHGDIYILARVSYEKYSCVSLSTGNRLREACEDMEKATCGATRLYNARVQLTTGAQEPTVDWQSEEDE